MVQCNRHCYSGPCSNVRYVGHFKNICLLTYLLYILGQNPFVVRYARNFVRHDPLVTTPFLCAGYNVCIIMAGIILSELRRQLKVEAPQWRSNRACRVCKAYGPTATGGPQTPHSYIFVHTNTGSRD